MTRVEPRSKRSNIAERIKSPKLLLVLFAPEATAPYQPAAVQSSLTSPVHPQGEYYAPVGAGGWTVDIGQPDQDDHRDAGKLIGRRGTEGAFLSLHLIECYGSPNTLLLIDIHRSYFTF